MDETNPYRTARDPHIPPRDSSAPTGPQAPPTVYAPPTMPGAIDPHQSTMWPKVFGTISIIVGALGFTCAGAGLLALPFSAQLTQGTPQVAAAMGPTWWILLSSSIGIALAVWLLVAGIQLVRRSRAGIVLHTSWAIAKILWVVVGSIASYALVTLPMLQSQAGPGAAPATGAVFGLIGLIFGIVASIAYPITVLIWLSRRAVKHETEAWR